MIVRCPGCGARFRFDERKVGTKGAKVRCSKCQQIFVIKPDGTVVGSQELDRTTRPALKEELEQTIKSAVSNEKAKRTTTRVPKAKIEELLAKAERELEEREGFDGIIKDPFSEKVLAELEKAVITPKVDVPQTELDMPKPDPALREVINRETYSHDKTPVLDKSQVQSDDQEVSVEELQAKIDHVTAHKFKITPNGVEAPPPVPEEDAGELPVDELQRKIDYVTSITAHRKRVKPPEPESNFEVEPPPLGGPGRVPTVTGASNVTSRKRRDPLDADNWNLTAEIPPPSGALREFTTERKRRGIADTPPSISARELSTGRRRNPQEPPTLTSRDFTTSRLRPKDAPSQWDISTGKRQNPHDPPIGWDTTPAPTPTPRPTPTPTQARPRPPVRELGGTDHPISKRGGTATGYYRPETRTAADLEKPSVGSLVLKLFVLLALVYLIIAGVASAMNKRLIITPSDIIAAFQGETYQQASPDENQPDEGEEDPFDSLLK